MQLWLVDINHELVNAWESEFEEFPNVHARCCNILEIAENTIVSPANGYGLMDGGIDLLYTEFFGMKPQQEIQKKIALRPEGYLPVGAAVLVNTGDKKIPYMISAPTMILPRPVNKTNVFFAMSAMLKVANRNRDKVKKIYCPGLATGTGRVRPEDAANEMAKSYKKWLTSQSS